MACGSPPPGSVDEETLLVDLESCARGAATCQRSGAVTAVEGLVEEQLAVRLTPGASITLPVATQPGRKLAWIAFGLRSEAVGRRLRITLAGREAAIAEPTWGWARVELSQGDVALPADARLTLSAETGTFDLLWVVGRWKRE